MGKRFGSENLLTVSISVSLLSSKVQRVPMAKRLNSE